MKPQSNLRYRQPVVEIARWVSLIASLLAAAVLVALVLVADYRLQDTRTVAVLALAGASVALGLLFFASAVVLRVTNTGVGLRLFPLIYIHLCYTEIKLSRVVELTADLQHWGSHGRARSLSGRIIAAGAIERAVQVETYDGRKYSVSLDPKKHDLEAIAADIADRAGLLGKAEQPQTALV